LIKLIFIILLISNISWAQESVYLDKDKPAPFSGYLVPEETIKNLRNDSLDAEMYRKIVPLKDNQIQLLTDQNTKLATTLISTTSMTTLEKVAWFAGGIIVTGLAVKAAHEIYK